MTKSIAQMRADARKALHDYSQNIWSPATDEYVSRTLSGQEPVFEEILKEAAERWCANPAGDDAPSSTP